VKYTLLADWPTLGKKLKKDVQRVKKALPSVSSKECKQFITEKVITVDGIALVEEDLKVSRSVDPESSYCKDHATNTDQEVLVILDTTLHPELQSEGLAREIINRVQKLRKKAGLVATDDVKMVFKIKDDPIGLKGVFEEQGPMIEKTLRRKVEERNDEETGELIAEEDQDIQSAVFTLSLLKL